MGLSDGFTVGRRVRHTQHFPGESEGAISGRIMRYHDVAASLGIEVKFTEAGDAIDMEFADGGDRLMFLEAAIGPTYENIVAEPMDGIAPHVKAEFIQTVRETLEDIGIRCSITDHGDDLHLDFESQAAAEAFQLLRDTGYFHKKTAARLGMTPPAVDDGAAVERERDLTNDVLGPARDAADTVRQAEDHHGPARDRGLELG